MRLTGFLVLRPQRNLCQIEPGSADSVAEIVEAAKRVISAIRPHSSQTVPRWASRIISIGVTFIEVNPLTFEDRGLFLQQMREKIPSPPD